MNITIKVITAVLWMSSIATYADVGFASIHDRKHTRVVPSVSSQHSKATNKDKRKPEKKKAEDKTQTAQKPEGKPGF